MLDNYIDPKINSVNNNYFSSNDALSDEMLFHIFESIKSGSSNFEGKDIEFKENFNWDTRYNYFKTMVAFSNANGGYLIFGIKDKPCIPLGLDEKRIDKFRDKDGDKWSTELRNLFNIEVIWHRRVFTFSDKIFGIIYVQESSKKPIICLNDSKNELRKGAIYYRYNSQSTIIEPGDLERLLDDEKKRYVDVLMSKVQLIMQAGAENAMVLDITSGKLKNNVIQNANIIIDSDTLKKIKFINEGHFTESEGEPALVLMGSVEKIINSDTKIIIPQSQSVALCKDDIFRDFLTGNNSKRISPEEYIKQMCSYQTYYFPIYYYIDLWGVTLDYVINYLKETNGQKKSRDNLINRIYKFKNGDYLLKPICEKNQGVGQKITSICRSKSVQMKKEFVQNIINEFDDIPEYSAEKPQQMRYFFQAIQSISATDINAREKYIMKLLNKIFENVYLSQDCDSTTKSEFRKALCWVDEALYIIKSEKHSKID